MIRINLNGDRPYVIVNGKKAGYITLKGNFEIDIDTKKDNIIKLKSMSGSSAPVQVSSDTGKDITLNYNTKYFHCFREGYYELVSAEGATKKEIIDTGKENKKNMFLL